MQLNTRSVRFRLTLWYSVALAARGGTRRIQAATGTEDTAG
jgi:hypothetical protein